MATKKLLPIPRALLELSQFFCPEGRHCKGQANVGLKLQAQHCSC